MKTNIIKASAYIIAAFAFLCSLLIDVPIAFVVGFFSLWINTAKKGFRANLVNTPQSFRELLPFFDANGLRHNIHYLNKIKNEIPFWQLHEQAEYADVITVKCLKEWDGWEIGQFESFVSSTDVSNFNAVGIGNLAYIAINTLHPEIRQAAENKIIEVKDYLAAFGIHQKPKS